MSAAGWVCLIEGSSLLRLASSMHTMTSRQCALMNSAAPSIAASSTQCLSKCTIVTRFDLPASVFDSLTAIGSHQVSCHDSYAVVSWCRTIPWLWLHALPSPRWPSLRRTWCSHWCRPDSRCAANLTSTQPVLHKWTDSKVWVIWSGRLVHTACQPGWQY